MGVGVSNRDGDIFAEDDVDTEPLSEDMGKATNGSARGDGVMEGARGNFRGTISLDCLTP